MLTHGKNKSNLSTIKINNFIPRKNNSRRLKKLVY